MFDQTRRQMRAVIRFGRCDRGHRRRLHQAGGMRLGTGDADRLERVGLIERVGEFAVARRLPIDQLVLERHAGWLRYRSWKQSRLRPCRCDGCGTAGGAQRLACRCRDGLTWREIVSQPAQQGRKIGGLTRRCRKLHRIVRRNLVDHRQPGLDRGAVRCEHAASDRCGEHHARSFLQPDEAIAPRLVIGRAVRPGDRNKPPAVRKSCHCR